MTGLAALGPLGPVAAFALRFPKIVSFAKRYWKIALAIALVVAACVSFRIWLHHRDDANFNRGVNETTLKWKAEVDKANAIAAIDTRQMQLMTERFGTLATTREQDVRVTLQPQIERITHEIESNPVYRQCLVTDGVRDALNTEGAAVNARIRSSAPHAAR